MVHIRGAKEFLAYFRALEQVRGPCSCRRLPGVGERNWGGGGEWGGLGERERAADYV